MKHRQLPSDSPRPFQLNCNLDSPHKALSHDEDHSSLPFGISPTLSLPLLVVVDMFAVSLVVPLLHQYYRAAGVTNARQRELLSSLFSSSQIVGGLIIGALSDAGVLSRRGILFLSFTGSAISYGLIMQGSIRALVCSRVLVGLVKQTMTVTTAMLARHTTKEDRATQMGRLTASSTVAWIIGPSAGALLYKHVNSTAPALVACGLFVLNSAIAATLLPKNDDSAMVEKEEHGNEGQGLTKDKKSSSVTYKFSSFTSNVRSCFSSKALASVVTSLLIFSWVTRATSYASMASYYEELYGIEPHQRGYLSSYQQMLNFIVQSTLVRPMLRLVGGERRAACVGAALLVVLTLAELWASFSIFVAVICPVLSVSVALLGLSLRSLVTQVAPHESLGSVLAALDVLQSCAAVTVPFYRTLIFAAMGRLSNDEEAAMRGDPNPYVWLVSSALHWIAAVVALTFLLRKPCADTAKGGKKEK